AAGVIGIRYLELPDAFPLRKLQRYVGAVSEEAFPGPGDLGTELHGGGGGGELVVSRGGKSSPTEDQPMKPPPTVNANTTAPNTNHRLGREPRRAVFPVGASEGAGSGTPASGATGPRRPVVEA